MTDEKDIDRHERQIETIFHKVNKALPSSIFLAVMTTMVIVGGSLFGLMYNDLQTFKTVSTKQYTEQRIEVITEIGKLRTLIEQKIK